MNHQFKRLPLARATGTSATDTFNIRSTGARGPAQLRDVWLIEKFANFAREVIPAVA